MSWIRLLDIQNRDKVKQNRDSVNKNIQYMYRVVSWRNYSKILHVWRQGFIFQQKKYVIEVSDFLKRRRAEMFSSKILIYDIAYLLWRE